MLAIALFSYCLLPVLSGLTGYVPPGPRFVCPKETLYIYPCKCLRGSDRGLYIHCENTNLASLSLAFDNLGNQGNPIEELTLYKCNIGRFYGPALYPLDVRVLRFVDTPIRLIEEHSFLGVNRTLQELYVHNTKLERFPREALQVLGNLSILSIAGHRISSLPANAFAESAASSKLERLEISNGSLSSLPVDVFAPLKRLKAVDLHGNNIRELKRNQFKGLRDAEVVDLSHNVIDKLDGSHLADLTKMTWCNLSYNAIADLKRGTFARSSVLKVLNLSHNKIRKLDSNTFRGMRFLTRLFLSDNQISEVGRATFGSITRIGTIDLARNFIKRIDFQMFNQLQFVELLDVSENAVTVVEKLAFKDLYLTRINLSHNEIANIEPGAFENCINMTILDLSHNKLANISKYSFDSNSYANEFQLSYNSFTSLGQVPLHNMTGLRILNVSHNIIQSVPRQTFPKLYELHTIDLSYNNLSEIYNAVFQTLFSLRSLNLSHNSLEKIKPSTFGPLPTLLELDMSYNRLSDVARGSLTRLPSCRELTVKSNKLKKIFQLPISLGSLDFSENELEEIGTMDVWPSMNALLSLDLSNNRLADNLRYGSFENLLTLRILNLQANNMTKPPWEALSTLTSLQYLYMQDNQVTELGKAAFGRLPIVFELNLANNFIRNVSSRAFEGLLQLLTLNLTNNALEHLPNGAFQGLVSLRKLDLSRNKLEKLDNKTHGLFDDCLSLEKLDLSHNKISFITRKTLPNDPWIPYKLREVDFSYNTMPVISFELTAGAKNIRLLNLSHNNINEIRRYVIGNLTSLRTLDLSYNEINDLSEPDSFVPPENLTNIDLSHNRLSHLPLNKIVKIANLKALDLSWNEMEQLPPTFMHLLKNGTTLRYAGNPLICDCMVRPLKRWLNEHTDVPEEWSSVRCAKPSYLAEKSISEITDDLLACDQTDPRDHYKSDSTEGQNLQDSPDFDITPDLKYRKIEYNNDDKMWKATWYVTSREDIGDFYAVVRQVGSSDSLIEKELVYKERSFQVRDLQDSAQNYELCVLARDSEGNVKHFRDSQCRLLSQPNSLANCCSGSTLLTVLAIVSSLSTYFYRYTCVLFI